MRVLLALGGNAMTNADGRARVEDQIPDGAGAKNSTAILSGSLMLRCAPNWSSSIPELVTPCSSRRSFQRSSSSRLSTWKPTWSRPTRAGSNRSSRLVLEWLRKPTMMDGDAQMVSGPCARRHDHLGVEQFVVEGGCSLRGSVTVSET
jgi:hypothetical protein